MVSTYSSAELSHFAGRSLPSDDARFDLLTKTIIASGTLLDARFLNAPKKPLAVFDVMSAGGPSEVAEYVPEPYFEAYSAKSVAQNEFVQPEMVCFCDIPVDPIDHFRVHTAKYGKFGLALRREFVIAQGGNPVFYIASSASTPLRLVGRGGPRVDFFADSGVPSLFQPRHRASFMDELKRRVVEAILTIRDINQAKTAEYQKGVSNADEHKRRVYQTFDLPAAIYPYIFGYTKVFDPTLPDEDPDNYYMEREWRVLGCVRFALSDIARIFVPPAYVDRVKEALSGYSGPVTALP
jgi:Putative abortive phage resistance protein AbiGi, antitoxin